MRILKTDKIMSIKDAVGEFIKDGDVVFIGGFVQSIPFGATHEIIRQKKSNLTVSSLAGTIDIDQMIGAGCIKNLISSYTWNPIPKPAYCFRRSLEKGIPHRVEFEEYSLLSLSYAYFAGSQNLPFIGTKTLLGTDFVTHRSHMGDNKLKIIESPFNGEKVCLIPPIKHDVGLIHVQRCDDQGNAQIWGMTGSTRYGINSCEKIVVCAEEIVDKNVIRQNPDHTIVPEFRVNAVVEEPWGCHPTAMLGYYDRDFKFAALYAELSKTIEGFERFLDEWVYGVKDRQEYLNKVGKERMERLSAGSWDSGHPSYGKYNPF